MKRRIYLKMKTLKEAQELFFSQFDFSTCLKEEVIPTRESLGRVTSEAIFAKASSPNFHAAAMDGMAVLAQHTYGTTEDKPKKLTVGQEAFPINTGNILPPGTNAVIMIEHVNTIDDHTIEIYSSVYPWQNVRKVGEDIVATELLMPQNHVITPYDMGALLGGGIYQVPVKHKAKVIIIPTGSELIEAGGADKGIMEAGKIVEYNSVILAGLVCECGGESISYDIIPDKYQDIRDALKKAVEAECHMVIVNAGSSAGSEDYTASAIEELGEVLVHGVTIMPGKPTVLGIINGKPAIGNPGYPVSAVISFEQFVKPILYKMLGIRVPKREKLKVVPSQKIPSKLGIEEFVRVKLGKVGEKTVATLLPRKAGVITSLTKADGIIRIPNVVEGITDDEEFEAELLKDSDEILNTIVIIGSHDNTLDILANEIKKWDYRLSISSSNVGSIGGLIALRKGNAHLAGSHLFDPETGDYNFPYVKRYLRGIDVKVVNLTFREQGLIVGQGNPKGIKGLEDLTRQDVVFINRQPGSGTRILLDYKLKQLNINPSQIKGYDRDEFTHMAVAVNVLSGSANVGLGIYAAAKALSLDFIPIVKERYDLIIPEAFHKHEKIQTLLKVIRSQGFKDQVVSLGGYDVSMTGEVLSG